MTRRPIRSPVTSPSPPRRPRRRRTPPSVWALRGAIVLLIAGLAGGGYTGWVLLTPTSPVAGPEAPVEGGGRPTAEPGPEPDTPPPRRDFGSIIKGSGDGLQVQRLQDIPEVLVLDFPSLAAQGKALNRVAALIEKAGLARNRVTSNQELARYIDAKGGRAETFYYGHNYTSDELAHFFSLAARDHVALTPAETRLHRLLRDVGAIVPDPDGGDRAGTSIGYVISLARMAGAPASQRRTILMHEIGHAIYDQRPAYRAYAQRFWHEQMHTHERQAFRRFLGARDYDISDAALLIDEMQAFLNFTPSADIINAQALGLAAGGLADLRARFRRGMPAAGRALLGAPERPEQK